MNSFTLKFYDNDFERHYTITRKIILSNHQLFLKILLMLLIVLIISENALNQLWVEMIYNMVGLLILFTSHYFKCYLQDQFHEACLLIVILIYNIQSPTALFLTGQLKTNSYSNGFYVSLVTIGVISPMDFIKKLVIIVLLFMIHVISTILTDPQWIQILLYLTSNIIMISYFYLSEKESRLTFIGIRNKTLIEEHFYKEMELQSFVVHYDSQQNSFHLVSQNQIKEIDDETQFNFTQFIRRLRVMVGYQGSHLSDFYSQEQINICRKLNLEQFLYYLFTNELKLQHLIFNKSKTHSYQMIGLVDYDFYQIKIIKTYDTQPCVIILIKQNRKESQKQQLKLKLKIANKQIELSQQSIYVQLRICLINLKYLFNQKHTSHLKKMNFTKLLQFLNSKITKVYNDINNLVDFNDINGKFNKIEQNYFDLEKEIKDCIQIVDNLNQGNKSSIEFTSQIKTKLMFSDQKKVKQLVLNLLFFLSRQTSKIMINISECEAEDSQNENLYLFEMTYSGLIFTKEKIHNLPIINPQNIEELKHNNSKQIDYEISIALMLVRQLGPYNQIKFKQGSKFQQSNLQFFLFQELQQFNLIPIISFPIKSYLISNQNFQKKQSQTYKSIDLQNKSMDVQLQTFRGINEQIITKI